MRVLGNIKKVFVGGLMLGSLALTGCLTDDDGEEEETPPKQELVSSKNVTVGAQANNDLGSFIDLDTYTVLKQGAAEAASGTIDLIFAYSGTANSSSIYSPHAAKAGIAGGLGLDIAQDLATANTTELRTVDASKFDAVTTVAGLDSLYDAGVAASPEGRLTLSNGFAFGAKTTGGKIVGMKITSVTTSTTGQAVIAAKAKW